MSHTTRNAIIALAAVATLGLGALASTEASAWPICCKKPMPVKPMPLKPFKPIVYPHHHHWHGGWRQPVYAAPVVTTRAVANCLKKEYTPEGAVVFKDLCTGEMAMNPPASPAPAVMN